MDAIVTFFEKFVSEFSWRRVVLVVAVTLALSMGLWVYEYLTGHFRSTRLQFAIEQLTKLSNPELKKNVQGDAVLERAYASTKDGLNTFIASSDFSLTLPAPLLKAATAAAPWFVLLAVVGFASSDKVSLRNAALGMMVVAIPFILVGVLLPTFHHWWVNHIAYPFCSMFVVVIAIMTWQHLRRPQSNPSPTV